MDKTERNQIVRCEMRDRMCAAVIDRMVLGHMEAMEQCYQQNEVFLASGHTWRIERQQSIWTLHCTGLHSWRVSFDTGWFKGPAGDGYEAVDTISIVDSLLGDTLTQLSLLFHFVAEFVVTKNPDGSNAVYDVTEKDI